VADSVQYIGIVQVAGQLTTSASYSHSNSTKYTQEEMIVTIYGLIKVMGHGLDMADH
jgi:hypothetical protein